MQKWINMFESNCDPAREDEYNAFCDEIHLPDVLETPGFVRARRFVNKSWRDGRGKYLALYDIETDDIAQAMKVRLEHRAEEHRQGRSSAAKGNLAFPLWRDLQFRQFYERTAPGNGVGKGKWVNFVEQNCHPDRVDEYHEWANTMHMPDALLTPGFVSARRYEIREPRDGRGTYLHIYEIETDDIDATMKLRLQMREAEVARGRASTSRNNLTWPVWRDVLWQQITDQEAKP